MVRRAGWLVVVALAACKTTPAPPPPPPPPPPAPPPVAVDHCAPTVAKCTEGAEALAEDDLNAALARAKICAACPGAPPTAYRLLASLETDGGHDADALATLRTGADRFEHNTNLWLALARAEMAASNPRRGIRAYAQVRRLAPQDENIEREYQYALAQHGTDEEKIEAKVAPLLLEAVGRYELDDTKGAAATLTAALAAAKGAPRIEAKVHHRLALIALSEGASKKAHQHFAAGLALLPNPTPARAELLLGYAELLVLDGRMKDAIAAASEATSIDPDQPLAHTNLAVAYAEIGKIDEALAALDRAAKAGIARRLSRKALLQIGGLSKLAEDPRFEAWLDRTWPAR